MNDTPTAQITALLQRHARLLDAGDFASVAELFSDSAILVNGQHIGTGSDFVHTVMIDSIITYTGDTTHHLRR